MRFTEVKPQKKLADHVHRCVFGSDRSRDQFFGLVREARSKQSFHLAVAPMTSLEVVRDEVPMLLRAGEEVKLSDAIAGTTVRIVLQKLIGYDAVIERGAGVTPPEAA